VLFRSSTFVCDLISDRTMNGDNDTNDIPAASTSDIICSDSDLKIPDDEEGKGRRLASEETEPLPEQHEEEVLTHPSSPVQQESTDDDEPLFPTEIVSIRTMQEVNDHASANKLFEISNVVDEMAVENMFQLAIDRFYYPLEKYQDITPQVFGDAEEEDDDDNSDSVFTGVSPHILEKEEEILCHIAFSSSQIDGGE